MIGFDCNVIEVDASGCCVVVTYTAQDPSLAPRTVRIKIPDAVLSLRTARERNRRMRKLLVRSSPQAAWGLERKRAGFFDAAGVSVGDSFTFDGQV